MIKTIHINTNGQGLYEFTHEVEALVKKSNISEGLCSVLVQHTSASLIIQENADPTARIDLENWLNRLVKENDPLYTHTLEGADDMPAHIKAALTSPTLTIPVVNKSLALGTWQGIYLWEHRRHKASRRVVVYIG